APTSADTDAAVPHAETARAPTRTSEPTYQTGITRPSIRAPCARPASPASVGKRRRIGLTTRATASSTPTMRPTTVAAMTASTTSIRAQLPYLALLDFLALLD